MVREPAEDLRFFPRLSRIELDSSVENHFLASDLMQQIDRFAKHIVARQDEAAEQTPVEIDTAGQLHLVIARE